MNAAAESIGFIVVMGAGLGWRLWETVRKQGTVRGSTSMRWSFYVMALLTALILTGTVLEFFLVDRRHYLAVSLAGVGLFLAANVLRLRAIRTLGQFWSLHIEIRDQHPFVQEGVYRLVRHPAYLAFLLEHVAVTLIGNAWWSLAATALAYLPMVWFRLTREEAALVAKFGDGYRAYQHQVGALIPKLSALRRPPDPG